MSDVEIKPQVYKDPRPQGVLRPVSRALATRPAEPVYEAVRVVTVRWR